MHLFPHNWVIPRISLTGRNIYVVYRGQTVISPALIGLLNLINASEIFLRRADVPRCGSAVPSRNCEVRGPGSICTIMPVRPRLGRLVDGLIAGMTDRREGKIVLVVTSALMKFHQYTEA